LGDADNLQAECCGILARREIRLAVPETRHIARVMNLRNLSLLQKGLCLIAVPLTFELLLVGWLYSLLNQTEAEAQREAHAKMVISTANKFAKDLVGAAQLVAGWNLEIDESNYDQVREQINQMRSHLDQMTELVKDDAEESTAVLHAREAIQPMLDMANHLRAVNKNDPKTADEFSKCKKQMQRIGDGLVNDWLSISEREKGVAAESPKRQAVVRAQFRNALLGSVVGSCLIAIALVWLFNRDASVRINRVVANTKHIVRGEELPPAIPGSDEIARLDEVIVQMAAELKEAAEMKRSFIEMASHDLRSPLSSIATTLANIESGMYGELNARGLQMLGSGRSNVQRLITLVNNILQLEQMEAGKLEITLKETTTTRVVERAVEALQDVAEKDGIVIRSVGTTHPLMADEDKLVQVLVNLISNAIKFSPPNSTVSVAAAAVNVVQALAPTAAVGSDAPEGKVVEFSVTDEGIGIPKDKCEEIFEKFSRIENGSERKPGNGLGLSIARMIVEAHGGTIHAAPLDKGSKFWFTV
jgi:signal transduction histidine kinase